MLDLLRKIKHFGKKSPLFLNKIKSKEKIKLVENDEIISSHAEVAKTFQNVFSFIIKNLTIQKHIILKQLKIIQF